MHQQFKNTGVVNRSKTMKEGFAKSSAYTLQWVLRGTSRQGGSVGGRSFFHAPPRWWAQETGVGFFREERLSFLDSYMR